jgi:hypothetical protein
MQNIMNTIAVLALLGTVISLFALSALLKMVRDLQNEVRGMASVAPVPTMQRSVPRFASADGLPTFVLVVREECYLCADRARRLALVAGSAVQGHLVLLAATPGCADWVASTDVTAIIDADLLGTVAVGGTPSLVKYAADGTEEWRRAVGSDEDLDTYLGVSAQEPIEVR